MKNLSGRQEGFIPAARLSLIRRHSSWVRPIRPGGNKKSCYDQPDMLFFLLFFLKLCVLYCRDKDPKIKKAQLPVEKKGQSVNVVLWVLNTLEEQAGPEPSAQSSAVRPQHKDSGTDYANVQYSLHPGAS